LLLPKDAKVSLFLQLFWLDDVVVWVAVDDSVLFHFLLTSPAKFSRFSQHFFEIFDFFLEIVDVLFVHISWSLCCLSIFGLLDHSFLLSGQFRCVYASEICKIDVGFLYFFFPNFPLFLYLLLATLLVLMRGG